MNPLYNELSGRCLHALAFASIVCFCGLAQAKVPVWVQEVLKSKASYSEFSDDATALILHDSLQRVYRENGSVYSRYQRAVHFKTGDQSEYAVAVAPMNNNSQKVTRFNAWILYPSGRTESFVKSDVVEVAANLDALISEAKSLVLDRSSSAGPDVVFAYEYEVAEKTIFLQTLWSFQTAIPTRYSSVEIEYPKGWTCEGQSINELAAIRHQDGETKHRWEAADLPGIKDEPHQPPASMLYTQVGISLTPDSGVRSSARLKSFESWNDVARYGFAVQADGLTADDAIAAKAKELADQKDDPWQIIQSVSEYAQSLNYVSIEMNLNSGGGYTPSAAKDVFRRHYGDCKDMTILTRSLLQVLGIKSYAVLASVGAETFVHDVWPSPLQFNHCIVGVVVAEEVEGPAVIDHPRLGRLLIFDPTQRFVPVGELPSSLQGTMILVASEDSENLVPLPRAAPGGNEVERSVTAELGEDGTLRGVIKERLTGSVAEYFRMKYRKSSVKEYEDYWKAWIAVGARGAVIDRIDSRDKFRDNVFELEIEFSAPLFARSMGEEMMIFNPIFLSRHRWTPPKSEPRQADYVFSPWRFVERTKFRFPEGFVVQEEQESIACDDSFASYRLASNIEPRSAQVNREMESRYRKVAAEGYDHLVSFFEEIARAESRPFVLTKE